MPDLHELTACRAADVIRRKELGALELLDSRLSPIEDFEPEINAWKPCTPIAGSSASAFRSTGLDMLLRCNPIRLSLFI
ncbi:hypothetical protein [Paraburkholderia sp. RL17-337-BIB-A]|uniref:hypothetical protein n=1 Tax=Paraburkholderia sp. RL17-337-BIB-A TaxID=3031636 RepID=UPI0038BA5C93